jgi:hypothetical protein
MLPGGPVRQIGLSYRAARATEAGGIDYLESIPGLLKRLQSRAHVWTAGRTLDFPLCAGSALGFPLCVLFLYAFTKYR